MIGVLFLCWIAARSSLSQIVTWTVETAVPKFNEPLKLTCTVDSGCCTSSFRIWEDASGTQIMNHGTSSDPAKYEEVWDGGTTGFSLMINNLQINDTDQDYDCRYNLGNDKHTLSQDATWEYQPTEEKCPIVVDSGYLKGSLHVARSAPYPTVVASYGGENITSYLKVTELTNFGTWFYSFTVSIDVKMDCKLHDTFTLSVVTGTTSKEICNKEDLCRCVECTGYWCLIMNIISLVATVIVIPLSCRRLCKHYSEDYEKGSANKTVISMCAIYLGCTVLLNIIIALVMGLLVCSCKEHWTWYFFVLMSLATGQVGYFVVHKFIEFDHTYLEVKHKKTKILGYFTAGIPILALTVVNKKCCKGGNNQSTESGSSCWPPCSVGQDPNSPDPENAKSLLKKKRADKITEEKPVAVVISQPPKARHVMTDNTESTKYSTEKEKFSAGLDKGKTTRPLPSIGQPTNSPRPLPQMPQGNQQEKGGIQLQPLGDSTSEKKKKKKRKKKAIKDSDEED